MMNTLNILRKGRKRIKTNSQNRVLFNLHYQKNKQEESYLAEKGLSNKIQYRVFRIPT